MSEIVDLDDITDALGRAVLHRRLTWHQVFAVVDILERYSWLADERKWRIYESLRAREAERERKVRREVA